LGLTPEQVAAEPHPQRFFEPAWKEDVKRLGLTPELFLPRFGQVLIWHANLLHGGSPVSNRKARRWSQVVHFYFENCLYTTPLKSFGPERGGTCFRQPVNIATGRLITLSMQRSGLDSWCDSPESRPKRLNANKLLQPRNWFARHDSSQGREVIAKLKGNLELISPSLVSGWVYHPNILLSDVRLVCGAQLLGSALIDVDRSDVCAALGVNGTFGFRLVIPDSHPEPQPEESIQILAFSADGLSRLPLKLSGLSAELTESRLRLSLASKYRGLRGHFDGLSKSGNELIGWCYNPSLLSADVWIHAEGLKPRKVSCSCYRPGLAEQVNHDKCGFVLPLSEWPEAFGRRIWASFDEEGLLQLPPIVAQRLPRS
jgi:hypothetical protein